MNRRGDKRQWIAQRDESKSKKQRGRKGAAEEDTKLI
jgi:hypothetical protein